MEECESLLVACLSRQARRKTPPPTSDHIAHEEWKRMRCILQKTTGPVGLSSVRTWWPRVAVVFVKRQKQNEGPIPRDDRGFVLV